MVWTYVNTRGLRDSLDFAKSRKSRKNRLEIRYDTIRYDPYSRLEKKARFFYPSQSSRFSRDLAILFDTKFWQSRSEFNLAIGREVFLTCNCN